MNGYSEPAQLQPPRIFERITVLSDPIRCRVLMLLEGQELIVSELCAVLQLPQSTVSRHLKKLADDGWVVARRDGTSRRYSARPDATGPAARRLWRLLRDEVASSAAAEQDRHRLHSVLEHRRTKSRQFFSTAAGRWAQLRRELFGERFELAGLLALLSDDWIVGDLGCGTGQTTASLAPFVSRVIAVDESDAMLAAARQRLSDVGHVELRQGRLEAIPIDDQHLDAAVMALVLHHLPDPVNVLAEAARTLKPGGRLLIVDMQPHEHEEFRHEMGHVWLGFHEAQLASWLGRVGFDRFRSHPLPADPNAKGPALFAASARRVGNSATEDRR